ncbi:hypothetical protein M9Y10_043720 [Tritrichomonas musculus]|uniref:G domain-containing protein n=1 Tax=Tritrichomonas musculus TaxID=1915356 RepID=A0ABR2K0K8_9EUKA
MEEDLSIAEILSELKELKTKLETMFDESNSNKTRVLLLGPTGVGKTTFTHLIAGCNMTAEKIRGNHNVVLNCKGNCKANNIKIGHTKNAETTLPSLLHNSDVLFCDCPGLLDNRSLQQRILNAFSIDHILAPPCKIKILLLLTQDHFEVDRGKSAIDLIDEAEKFFTDYEQMEKCVGLVITKMNPLNNPAELLDDFQDYTNKHPLLDFFINHPDRCFSVHQPVELGNYNNFHDRSKILSFVKTDVVQNPKHSVIIDDGTIQTLCVECNEMNEKMNDRLLEFSHDLSERCRNVTEISKLNEWINIIKELRSSLSQGIELFYQKILEYPAFESIQNVLEIFILWNEFFNQVVLKTLPSKDKYLFKCNSIIQTFDNQIEDLQKRRDSAETKIELSRDQNVFSIVQQLDQIIKSAGVIFQISGRPSGPPCYHCP